MVPSSAATAEKDSLLPEKNILPDTNYLDTVWSYFHSRRCFPADSAVLMNRDASGEWTRKSTEAFHKELREFPGYEIRFSKSEKSYSLSVNGKEMNLKSLTTQNQVWSNRDKLGDWQLALHEVFLYKSHQGDLLHFILGIEPCNGTACSVTYSVFYTPAYETLTAFGSFRNGEDKFRVIFMPSDSAMAYVAATYEDQFPSERRIFRIWQPDSTGVFQPVKDGKGNVYKITLLPDSTGVLSRMQSHWFEPVHGESPTEKKVPSSRLKVNLQKNH